MAKARYEISGCLEVLTPLHLGSGAFATRNAVKGKDGEPPPQVALIVRDASGAPYLPPTSLKGLLLRLTEERLASEEEKKRKELIHALFGQTNGDGNINKGEKDVDDEEGAKPTGRMGALILRGAVRSGPVPDVRDAPYADAPDVSGEPKDGYLGPGVFIAARTRIDAASGTARDGNLFFQEMVAPGTRFDFRCLIETRGEGAAETAEARLRDLLPILKMLTTEGGRALGKGGANGFGRVRLSEGSVRIHRRSVDPDGGFPSEDVTALWRDAETPEESSGDTRTLTLVCREPFATLDASRAATFRAPDLPEPDGPDKAVGKDRGKPTQPQLQAQRLAERQPLLLGSGVSGALRARARWLAALGALKDGKDPAMVDPAAGKVVSSVEEVKELTPVQRLFGVTGFAGLLAIDRLEVSEAEPWDVTSVKLDRFSGAPVDNALFTTGTFVGVRLVLGLSLRKRGAFPYPDDRALFERLVEDIEKRGIELGHGGNKGFGWFVDEKGERPWRMG